MPKTKKIKVVKELRCALTDEELLERGQSLARTLEQIQKREADGKAYAAAVKSDIEGYKSEGQKLYHQISEKSEWRQVECNEVHDFEKWRVSVVRTDTGEIVSERAMWDEERQDEIAFLDEPAEQGAEEAPDSEESPV